MIFSKVGGVGRKYWNSRKVTPVNPRKAGEIPQRREALKLWNMLSILRTEARRVLIQSGLGQDPPPGKPVSVRLHYFSRQRGIVLNLAAPGGGDGLDERRRRNDWAVQRTMKEMDRIWNAMRMKRIIIGIGRWEWQIAENDVFRWAALLLQWPTCKLWFTNPRCIHLTVVR